MILAIDIGNTDIVFGVANEMNGQKSGGYKPIGQKQRMNMRLFSDRYFPVHKSVVLKFHA